MVVTEYADTSNRTIIESRLTEVSGGIFYRRLRVYDINGNHFDLNISDSLETTIIKFAIEDYPDRFITPFPSATQGYVRVELEYKFKFVGDWYVYNNQRYEIRYTIRKNTWTAPTVSMSLYPINTNNGYNLAGLTSVRGEFQGGTKYGASIKSYNLNVEGKNYNTEPYTSHVLTTSGNVVVTGTVTDSRGFTASVSQTLTVLANMPLLNSFNSNTEYIDGVISYSFTPPISFYYSKVRIDSIVDGVASEVRIETIGASAGTVSKTLTFLEEQLKNIYERYPETVNTKLRMTLLTYKDSSYSASSLMSEQPTLDLELKIPENEKTKPKIDSITCVPSVVLLGRNDLFVQGKNGINTTITATGQYKAQIVSRSWIVGGNEFSSGESSGTLNASGAVTITATVVDKRGFSRSKTQNVNYEAYLLPAVVPIDGQTAVQAERESGDSTDKLKVVAAKRFSSLASNNKCELRCRLKVGMNGTYGDYIALLDYASATNSFNGQIETVALDKDKIYYVEISAIDALDGVGSIVLAIPSEAVFMDRDGVNNSIAFGGYVDEQNAFEVYQTAFFRGGMYFDDLSTGKRYKITIGESGQLVATEERMTFSLRR